MGLAGTVETSGPRWRRGRIGAASRPIVLLVLLALLLAACGGSPAHRSTSTTGISLPRVTPTTATPTTPTTTRPATRSTTGAPATDLSTSPGCGHAATTGTTILHLRLGGHQRMAIVHVPVGYHDKTAIPLVLNLHGSESTAFQQEVLSGMNATADAETFIVAYPQGAIRASSGFEWNVPGEPLLGGRAVPAGSPNDVAFLEQLVSQLTQTYCIDRTRVDVTGFSGGARMASQLGCDAVLGVRRHRPGERVALPEPVSLHAAGAGCGVPRHRGSGGPLRRQRSGLLDLQRADCRGTVGQSQRVRDDPDVDDRGRRRGPHRVRVVCARCSGPALRHHR